MTVSKLIRPGSSISDHHIAVLLPCYNEAATIAAVIAAFRASLPDAIIYVFDNNSSDDTALIAEQNGALVVREGRQGKGNVVRRMFSDVDADIYVMADGDGTYDAKDAPMLIETLVNGQLEMVVGTRRNVKQDAGRNGHAFGNRLFNAIFGQLFGNDYTDIFSGYRVFSRRFAKSFPAISEGFEIETEMSVHASQMMMPVAEVETDYGVRPEGSASKLRTFRDGFRILRAFLFLLKETRPFYFFGWIAAFFAAASLGFGIPVVLEFWETGLVERLPTTLLSASLMIIAMLVFACGLILDSLSRSRLEQKRMLYLMLPKRSASTPPANSSR